MDSTMLRYYDKWREKNQVETQREDVQWCLLPQDYATTHTTQIKVVVTINCAFELLPTTSSLFTRLISIRLLLVFSS